MAPIRDPSENGTEMIIPPVTIREFAKSAERAEHDNCMRSLFPDLTMTISAAWKGSERNTSCRKRTILRRKNPEERRAECSRVSHHIASPPADAPLRTIASPVSTCAAVSVTRVAISIVIVQFDTVHRDWGGQSASKAAIPRGDTGIMHDRVKVVVHLQEKLR